MIFQAEFSVEGGNIHPTKVGKDGASSDVPRPWWSGEKSNYTGSLWPLRPFRWPTADAARRL